MTSRNKAVIILKPPLLKNQQAGELLQLLEEQAKLSLLDTFCIDLSPEDVYEFHELELSYPTPQEVESFLGGRVLVLGMVSEIYPSRLEKMKLEAQYALKVFLDPDGHHFRFWFGSDHENTNSSRNT